VGIIIALRKFVRCVTTRKPYARNHTRLSAFDCRGHGTHQIWAMVMKIERFAGHHHEARDALVLSVAGVTAIMLIESLILLILY
jgi:hypothetical protein